MSRAQAIRITPARRAVRASLSAARFVLACIGASAFVALGTFLLWALFAVALGWSP